MVARPGGYVWAVLEPLGMIAFLSMAFALVMRSPSLGNSFILFYATAYMPYSLYNKVSRNGDELTELLAVAFDVSGGDVVRRLVRKSLVEHADRSLRVLPVASPAS